MKCSRCNREISESQAYVYHDKVYCESCLMDIGLSTHECDPWATYVDTSARKRRGMKGVDGLTDPEKKLYEFIRGKGKVTRDDAMAGLKLSEAELKAQLIPLMHYELVKEAGEKGNLYLVPID